MSSENNPIPQQLDELEQFLATVNPKTSEAPEEVASLLSKANAAYRKIKKTKPARLAGSAALASFFFQTAEVYHGLRMNTEALAWHQRALDLWEQTLDADHPDRRRACQRLGILYQEAGQFDLALDLLIKALPKKERSLWADPQDDVSSIYIGIGSVLESLNRQAEAIPYYHKAAAVFEDFLGPGNPVALVAYDLISQAYRQLGDYQQALEYQLKILPFEALSPSPGILYRNIARCYLDVGEREQALAFQRQAVGYFKEGGELYELVRGELDGMEAANGN